jgi:hypothetical protein
MRSRSSNSSKKKATQVRPIGALGRWKDAMNARSVKAWLLHGKSLFKGGSPHSHPQASRAKSPPTCSRVPTLRHGGWVPHVMRADPKREEGKLPHAKHETAPWLYALSSSPKPAVKKADRLARSMQPHHGRTPFQLRCNRWSSMGARSHMSCNRRTGYYMQGNRTATCANAASSRLQNQCSDSRQPRV